MVLLHTKVLLLAFVMMSSSPLGLPNWGQETTLIQQISGYRHYYGTPSSGTVVYLGRDHLEGLETEVHLSYQDKVLSSAVLILGPLGFYGSNCFVKYKKIIKLYDEKYGPYKKVYTEKNSDIDDLFYTTACKPISLGLYRTNTFWSSKHHDIRARMFGEYGEVYIEIDYTHRKQNLKQEKNKTLKKI